MRPLLRTTYTYVTMELSPATYAEIRKILMDAGYNHAFHEDGIIDMNGLAVKDDLNKAEYADWYGTVVGVQETAEATIQLLEVTSATGVPRWVDTEGANIEIRRIDYESLRSEKTHSEIAEENGA